MSGNLLNQFLPITGEKVGSFAHFTIKERLPLIIDRLLEDHKKEEQVINKLQLLRESILHGKIEQLPSIGPGLMQWKAYLTPYLGLSWFEAPFYFIEAYFYRMILESVSYFEKGTDPFLRQKETEIKANFHEMEKMLKSISEAQADEVGRYLNELFQLSLWGNKADLSQLKINTNIHSTDLALIDDSDLVIGYLGNGVSRIDMILDNSGMELFTDIVLSIRLLQIKLVDRVVLHAKAFPTFVSDATEHDFDVLIDHLKMSEQQVVADLVTSFNQYIGDKSLIISSDDYWNSPLHFYQMPQHLHKDLAKSDLIIFKGDANYRRIFGDRLMPIEMPVADLTKYLPAKSLGVRILKSEILVGFDKERASNLNQSDPDWRYSGKYGIVQLLN